MTGAATCRTTTGQHSPLPGSSTRRSKAGYWAPPSRRRSKIFVWTVGTILAVAFFVGFIFLIVKIVPHRRHHAPPPDNYTVALRKALMFFNAQKSGKLPNHNNVSWRGNSCLNDGKSDTSTIFKDLKGGYYDAGDAIKFHFPKSFSLTMLSWSVIEYSAKYDAAGELNHVKDIIKWGTDYLLKTFNSSADSIDRLVAQGGGGGNDEHTAGGVIEEALGGGAREEEMGGMRAAATVTGQAGRKGMLPAAPATLLGRPIPSWAARRPFRRLVVVVAMKLMEVVVGKFQRW